MSAHELLLALAARLPVDAPRLRWLAEHAPEDAQQGVLVAGLALLAYRWGDRIIVRIHRAAVDLAGAAEAAEVIEQGARTLAEGGTPSPVSALWEMWVTAAEQEAEALGAESESQHGAGERQSASDYAHRHRVALARAYGLRREADLLRAGPRNAAAIVEQKGSDPQ